MTFPGSKPMPPGVQEDLSIVAVCTSCLSPENCSVYSRFCHSSSFLDGFYGLLGPYLLHVPFSTESNMEGNSLQIPRILPLGCFLFSGQQIPTASALQSPPSPLRPPCPALGFLLVEEASVGGKPGQL